jgi:hypothetical protein
LLFGELNRLMVLIDLACKSAGITQQSFDLIDAHIFGAEFANPFNNSF